MIRNLFKSIISLFQNSQNSDLISSSRTFLTTIFAWQKILHPKHPICVKPGIVRVFILLLFWRGQHGLLYVFDTTSIKTNALWFTKVNNHCCICWRFRGHVWNNARMYYFWWQRNCSGWQSEMLHNFDLVHGLFNFSLYRTPLQLNMWCKLIAQTKGITQGGCYQETFLLLWDQWLRFCDAMCNIAGA